MMGRSLAVLQVLLLVLGPHASHFAAAIAFPRTSGS